MWLRSSDRVLLDIRFACGEEKEYLSTNVILSAISATLLAILLAMIAYADVTPFAGISPATECALLATGAAFCEACFATPLGSCREALGFGRFVGTGRGADGLRGITPLTEGRLWAWVAMLTGVDLLAREIVCCARTQRLVF